MKSLLALGLAAISFVPALAAAHCQIPCGIYDDHARIHEMREHVLTIDKSVRLINELTAKSDPQSLNQKVRWIQNKEAHAEKIIRIVSDYFLVQKIKPDAKNYVDALKAHHAVMKAAMVAKQKASPNAVKSLRQKIDVLEKYWPKK